MASLNFKGKSAVWNHHLSVPYHTLEKDAKKSLKGSDDAENLVIQGDNLLALKALLPKYQGRVNCIYIDPPYNTGYENWIYNDSVNSPLIKDWLGGVVASDDLTKHDKWLCMMTPRLKLLRELLAEDGIIFVNIDDNEVHHLRTLMNEIFGEGYYIGDIIWKKTSGDNKPSFAYTHDNILIYGRATKELPRVILSEDQKKQYSNPDNDPRGPWAETDYRTKWSKSERPNLYYAIVNPNTKEKIYPDTHSKSKRVWAHSVESHNYNIENNLVWWGIDGKSVEPKKKRFLSEHEGTNIRSVWIDAGTNDEAGKELGQIIEDDSLKFDNPKPLKLIKKIVSIFGKDSIILDSFAGSGTTAHAVLDLNKEDKEDGKRKFIVVEMEDYANKLTAERVRRVIKEEKLKTGFTYCTLGSAIDAESILAGKLPKYAEFAKYVYYLATGMNHPNEDKIKESEYFVGKAPTESIYLLYDKDLEKLKTLAITLDWAQKIHAKDSGKKVVYAPACYLDEESLDQFNIKFVSIPYNLFERTT